MVHPQDVDFFDEFGPEHFQTRPDDLLRKVFDPTPITCRSGIALRLTREGLGLSGRDLAQALHVATRTVQRWETLESIPPWVEHAVNAIGMHTVMWEAELLEADRVGVRRGGYRMVGQFVLPESWWRAVVGRALARKNLEVVELGS